MSVGHQRAPVVPSSEVSAPGPNDGWTLVRTAAPEDDTGWLSEGSLFALADGVLGVRGGIEELQPSGGGTYLSRVYDTTPINYHERFSGFPTSSDTRLPVADGATIEIRLGDTNLSDGQIVEFSRELNLQTGELVRSTRWRTPNGVTVDVVASRVVFGGGVLAIRLAVRSNDYSGPVTFTSRLKPGAAGVSQTGDPRHGVGTGHRLETTNLGADRDEAWLVQRGRHSLVGGAVAQIHRAEQLQSSAATLEGEGAATIFAGELAAGRQAALEKMVVYVPFDAGDAVGALRLARERADQFGNQGYAVCATAAAAELAPFWDAADIEIPGNPKLERAMRFNLMHLRRSAPADGRTGLAAKGLTGEGYQGHAFWDTEAFALPVLALTAPGLARSNLAFRIAGLDRARAHARELNHRSGALYPWRTIAGDEGSSYFPGGSAQYHINAAIAYAVRVYDQATGDDSFVLGEAAAMVFETARLWLDVGSHDPRLNGAFRICEVTGPDEYTVLVDDDHYTHRMAQMHIRYALELAERAPHADGAPDTDEQARWAAAADRMHLPRDPELRVYPQDAIFLDKPEWPFGDNAQDRPLLLHYHPLTLYRHQVIKQASVVLAHAMTGDGARAQERRDFDYYEPRTTHDSTLSAASHAIVAAHLGRSVDAYRFFRECVFVDLDNLHGNVAHGLHMASMAGGWQALVWGFAGLRIEWGGLTFVPRSTVDLPEYAFSLIWRGAKLRVAVNEVTCRYALAADGEALTLKHDGLEFVLAPGAAVERPTPRFGAEPSGPVRALIFDLDGVLTDSARAHYVAWEAIADDLGIPFDEQANEELKGIDRLGSLDLILARGKKRLDAAERQALAERKNAHYQELIAGSTPADVLPGAREALERARAEGLPMAIASASRNAPILLKRLGIAHFFDAVVDPASIARSKPDPAIFLEAARELDVDPAACLGIEDSRAGIAAIKAAGMTALGIGDPAILTDADLVVADLGGVDWSDPLNVGPANA